MRRARADRRGATVLELAVALLILAGLLLGSLAAVSATAGSVERARRVSSAVLTAQDELEGLLLRPFGDVPPIVDGDCTRPPPAGFGCSVTVRVAGDRLKRVTVTVSQGGETVYSLVDYLADGL